MEQVKTLALMSHHVVKMNACTLTKDHATVGTCYASRDCTYVVCMHLFYIGARDTFHFPSKWMFKTSTQRQTGHAVNA